MGRPGGREGGYAVRANCLLGITYYMPSDQTLQAGANVSPFYRGGKMSALSLINLLILEQR